MVWIMSGENSALSAHVGTIGESVIHELMATTLRNYRLKAVLQIMACSEAGRDVVYFTFGNKELQVRRLCNFTN